MVGTEWGASIGKARASRDRLLLAAQGVKLRRPVEFEGLSRRALNERLGGATAVSQDLRVLWTIAAPVSFSVPFSPEHLVLYNPEQLAARQIGYVGEGWDPAWLVIGDSTADPVIANLGEAGTPISLAMHGVGSWSPTIVAPDPCAFLESIAVWLEVLSEFGGDFIDNDRDFAVKPGFFETLTRRLDQVLPPDCVQALVRYIQT